MNFLIAMLKLLNKIMMMNLATKEEIIQIFKILKSLLTITVGVYQ